MKKIIVLFLTFVSILGAVFTAPLTAFAATAGSPATLYPDPATGMYYYISFPFKGQDFKTYKAYEIEKSENGGLNHSTYREFNLEVQFPDVDDEFRLVFRVMAKYKNAVSGQVLFLDDSPKVLVNKDIYDRLVGTKSKQYYTLMYNKSGGAMLLNSTAHWPWEDPRNTAAKKTYNLKYTQSMSASLDTNAIPMDGYYNSVPVGNQEEIIDTAPVELLDRLLNALYAVWNGTATVLDWLIFAVEVIVGLFVLSLIGTILKKLFKL